MLLVRLPVNSRLLISFWGVKLSCMWIFDCTPNLHTFQGSTVTLSTSMASSTAPKFGTPKSLSSTAPPWGEDWRVLAPGHILDFQSWISLFLFWLFPLFLVSKCQDSVLGLYAFLVFKYFEMWFTIPSFSFPVRLFFWLLGPTIKLPTITIFKMFSQYLKFNMSETLSSSKTSSFRHPSSSKWHIHPSGRPRGRPGSHRPGILLTLQVLSTVTPHLVYLQSPSIYLLFLSLIISHHLLSGYCNSVPTAFFYLYSCPPKTDLKIQRMSIFTCFGYNIKCLLQATAYSPVAFFSAF